MIKKVFIIIPVIFNIVLVCICIIVTIAKIKSKLYQILSYQICLIILWNNVIFSCLTLINMFYVTFKDMYIYNCIISLYIMSFVNYFTMAMILFLTFQQYFNICCSPQFYIKYFDKNKKYIYYLVIIIIDLIICAVQFDWYKIFYKYTLYIEINCSVNRIFHFHTTAILAFILNVIFLIFSLFCLIKVYIFIKKNKNVDKNIPIEKDTYHMFRSARVLSEKCVEIVKGATAVIICYLLMIFPMQMMYIFRLILDSHGKKFEILKQVDNNIYHSIISIYLLLSQIMFIIFSPQLRHALLNIFNKKLQ